jgi:opacity protein-like surface antigen
MVLSKKIILLAFLLATTLYSNAVELQADSAVAKTTPSGPKKSFYLPILSFAQGVMNFNGDVGYNKFNQPFTARSAFQIELQFQSSHRLSFALFLLSGRAFGDEKTVLRTANFKSTIVSEGFMLRYDFISNKNDDQILVPYLTAGVEYMFFRSKTDLLDATGKKYQYWDDGSIRDIAQTDPTSDQAVLLHRDYNYETDLRDANLDNLGKYRTTAFGLPVGAGVRFQISPRISMHFSSVCHFAGTDMIDGISEDGKGSFCFAPLYTFIT